MSVRSSALVLLATLTWIGCATNPHPAQEEQVHYGKPAAGKICVTVNCVPVKGGYRFPGIYWLQKDTKLTDLLERAEPVGKSQMILVIRVKKGKKEKYRFWDVPLREVTKGAPANTFILQDGDDVRKTHDPF